MSQCPQKDESAIWEFLKRRLSCVALATYELRSYPVAMRELGNLSRHAMGGGSGIGQKISTYHLGDESG